MQASGIHVAALDRKPELEERIYAAFLAYRRLTSRIPVSEVESYCRVMQIRDVEWMLEMVQQLDKYMQGRMDRAEEEPNATERKSSDPYSRL